MALLERDSELSTIEGALAASRRGAGAMLLIEGPAGIGKTAILDEAGRRASERGFLVRHARGGVLEREIAHGIARQLLEPLVSSASADRRATLLADAAVLAAPVVLPEPAGSSPADGAAADHRAPVVHGLYWLTANLAAEVPLLLAIDDVQWADAASLRFLAYLASRLDGLSVTVIAAIRTGERASDEQALGEMTVHSGARVLAPAPLSADAVRRLVRTTLAADAATEFVSACREATGGVPFLLTQLLAELHARGAQPTADIGRSLPRVTSRTVANATRLRLARLGPDATAVATAAAVLGRHADVRRVARLCRLEADRVLVAQDELVAAQIVNAGRPIAFLHPIVEASVYEAIPAGRRALAHAETARLLLAEGADPEDVCAHVLLTEPPQGTEFVGALRTAARAALDRAAPESAVEYLGRCVAEELAVDVRAEVLHELGRAEATARESGAVAHLESAVRLSADPVARARVARDLVETLGFVTGPQERTVPTADRALEDLGDLDEDLATQLEVFRGAITSNDPRTVDSFMSGWDRLVHLAERPGRGGRLMAALLSSAAVCRAEPEALVMPLIDRALENGVLVAGDDADTWGLQPAAALVFLGHLDRGLDVADALRDSAVRRGSVMGFVRASALRALVLCNRGDLRGAEAEVRAALDARHEGLVYSAPSLLRFSVEAIIERPGLDDVAAAVEAMQPPPAVAASFLGAWLFETRGRVRLGRGDPSGGADDLRRCGAVMAGLQFVNPLVSGWRSALAVSIHEQQPSEARRLAAEELEIARGIGLARPVGIALRAAGIVDPGRRGPALLEESLATLDVAVAPLERARTLVAIGRAHRDANRPAQARRPLAEGLDLAHRCGAERLAARAEAELRACGARPRRRAVSGLDALTPSEDRVARQAARGMSNREIAQALFVTAKTVENQLGVVYQKLGVRGRRELAVMIGPGRDAVSE